MEVAGIFRRDGLWRDFSFPADRLGAGDIADQIDVPTGDMGQSDAGNLESGAGKHPVHGTTDEQLHPGDHRRDGRHHHRYLHSVPVDENKSKRPQNPRRTGHAWRSHTGYRYRTGADHYFFRQLWSEPVFHDDDSGGRLHCQVSDDVGPYDFCLA